VSKQATSGGLLLLSNATQCRLNPACIVIFVCVVLGLRLGLLRLLLLLRLIEPIPRRILRISAAHETVLIPKMARYVAKAPTVTAMQIRKTVSVEMWFESPYMMSPCWEYNHWATEAFLLAEVKVSKKGPLSKQATSRFKTGH
jgi:hypothetical protein